MQLFDPVVRRRAYERPEGNIVPMGIHDNGPLIDRAYQFAAPGQWVRELAINGIEAGATRIVFGVDWNHVDWCLANDVEPVFRLRYEDDGHGMDPDEELEHYFNKLSASSKTIGEHGNFGVGAKISLLPWNRAGLVVMSWQLDEGGMIAMTCGRDGNYGVVRHPAVDAFGIPSDATVIEPPPEYRPLQGDTGVSVVAYGNTGKEHTFYGPEKRNRAAQAVLERRIFSMPETIDVSCETIHLGMDPRKWPDPDPRRTGNVYHSRITPMKELLQRWTTPETRGFVTISDAVVHWWLLEPVGVRPRSSVVDVFANTGTVATLYRDDRINVTEVYDLIDDAAKNSKNLSVRFRFFGVPYRAIQQRLVLLVEPRKRDEQAGIEGVLPDPQRRGLAYDGGELPWPRWGRGVHGRDASGYPGSNRGRGRLATHRRPNRTREALPRSDAKARLPAFEERPTPRRR